MQRIKYMLFIIFILAADICIAEMMMEPPLNVTTYFSEDKTYSLKVIPSARHGEGKGRNIFSQNDKILWEKETAFTLREVKISNNGVIAGYSYNNGYHGFKGESILYLWLLDEKGSVRYSKEIIRNIFGLDQPNYPTCKGVLLHENFDNAIFRVYTSSNNDKGEKWYIISLNTGKEKGVLHPKNKLTGYKGNISQTIAFPDHPFLLLSLISMDIYPAPGYSNAAYSKYADNNFAVIDYNGNPLWGKKYTSDLDFQALGCESKDVNEYLENTTLTGLSSNPNEFWLSSLKNNEKTYYRMSDSAVVTQTGTEQLNWLGPKSVNKEDTAEVNYHYAPPYLFRFQAVSDADIKNKPQSICLFDFNPHKMAGCISCHNGQYFFYLIDSNNKVINWSRLDSSGWDQLKPSCIKYWKDREWLLLVNFNEMSKLFVLSSKGKIKRELPIDFPGAKRLVTDSRGNISIVSTTLASIKQFNSEGKEIWAFSKKFGEPGGLLHPEDITITKDNDLIVLDNITEKLQLYSGAGNYIKTIEIKKTESGKIGYPTFLTVDKDDVIYVKNQSGKHGIHKFSSEGKWLGSITLKHNNGRKVSYIQDMVTGSGDQLCVSDDVLLFVDKNGRETSHLGNTGEKSMVGRIDEIDTDRDGNIYFFEEKRYSVSKYSPEGNHLLSFGLSPDDIPSPNSVNKKMFIDYDDYININTGGTYIRFNTHGKAVDRKKLFEKKRFDSREIIARKDKAGYWYKEFHIIKLLDENGKELKTIKQDADGNWLDGILNISTDIHGQLITGGINGTICIFGNEGTPLAVLCKTGKEDDFSVSYLSGKYIYSVYPEKNLIRITDFKGGEISVFPDPSNQPAGFSFPGPMHVDGQHNRLYVQCDNFTHVFDIGGIK